MGNYPKLDLITFGRHLFKTGDLDPVYVSLQGAKLEPNQLDRWLIAYWCFYNCGFASFASEQTGRDYWSCMEEAAENKTTSPLGGRWPRGSERRHFRGAASIRAVESLSRRYGNNPSGMIDYLVTGPMSVREVISRATTHVAFGAWAGFKTADMIDVFIEDVDQNELEVFLYSSPRKSILEHIANKTIPVKDLKGAMFWLQKALRGVRIPHKPHSLLPDWFALETVWCKHRAHLHGSYPLYKDIREIKRELELWAGATDVAGRLLDSLPALKYEEV